MRKLIRDAAVAAVFGAAVGLGSGFALGCAVFLVWFTCLSNSR